MKRTFVSELSHCAENENGKTVPYYRNGMFVDTESEINDPDFCKSENLAIGSFAYAIDSHTMYMLNSSGEWIKQ